MVKMGTEVAIRKVCSVSFQGQGINPETLTHTEVKNKRLMLLQCPALKSLFSTLRYHRGQHYPCPN